MTRFFFAVLTLVGLMAGPLPAQDPVKDRLDKSPRHHEWETIKTAKGRQVKTFIVFPEVKKPATTVVVIHENKGLTDWVTAVADRLAEHGYVALAPDLLSQMGPKGGNTDEFKSPGDATKAIAKVTAEQANSDIDAVVDYAKTLKASNKKVTVGGFCWGGGKTFGYAVHNPDIAAAFVFYGSAPKSDADYKKIKTKVYGFYGGDDARITEEVPDVEKKMKAAGRFYDPVIYPGAGHGFLRAGELPDAKKANSDAQKKGWERWQEILKAL